MLQSRAVLIRRATTTTTAAAARRTSLIPSSSSSSSSSSQQRQRLSRASSDLSSSRHVQQHRAVPSAFVTMSASARAPLSRRGVSMMIPYTFEDNEHNVQKAGLTVAATGVARSWDSTRVRTNITLTDNERKLFAFLLEVNQKYELGSVLRVAGGWVRDKCLGLNPHDIDIALDNMKGEAFANKVNDLLLERELETHRIGVIKSNPDQSKHLETATTTILGLEIDFVHLRTEEYTDGSRIPSAVGIGTPHQDCMRRDLTINALYYNINSGEIEDFTEHGLDDLRNGVIRTPLPPLTTFEDDPLRVLRAIRFASRFHCAVDDALLEAAQDAVIRDALEHKVSRERVGKELEGCFSVDPVHAFRLLYKLMLYDIVFKLPADVQIEGHYRYRSLEIMTQVDRLIASVNSAKLQKCGVDAGPRHAIAHVIGDNLSPEEVRMTLMAAFFFPIATYTYKTPKNKKEPAIRYIVEHQLKWPSREANMIVDVASGAVQLARLTPEAVSWRQQHKVNPDPAAEKAMRLRIGSALRAIGPQWRLALTVAAGVDLPKLRFDMLATETLLYWEALDPLDPETAKAIAAHHELLHTIHDFGLADALSLRPLFRGDELCEMFQRNPGPWTADLIKHDIEWQMQNPGGLREDCEVVLREFAASQSPRLFSTRSKKPRKQ